MWHYILPLLVAHAFWTIFFPSPFYLKNSSWSFGTQVRLYLLLRSLSWPSPNPERCPSFVLCNYLALWDPSTVSESPAYRIGWGIILNGLCEATFFLLTFLPQVQTDFIQGGAGAMVPSDVGCDLQATLPKGIDAWDKYPGERPGESPESALGEASCLLGPLVVCQRQSWAYFLLE